MQYWNFCLVARDDGQAMDNTATYKYPCHTMYFARPPKNHMALCMGVLAYFLSCAFLLPWVEGAVVYRSCIGRKGGWSRYSVQVDPPSFTAAESHRIHFCNLHRSVWSKYERKTSSLPVCRFADLSVCRFTSLPG